MPMSLSLVRRAFPLGDGTPRTTQYPDPTLSSLGCRWIMMQPTQKAKTSLLLCFPPVGIGGSLSSRPALSNPPRSEQPTPRRGTRGENCSGQDIIPHGKRTPLQTAPKLHCTPPPPHPVRKNGSGVECPVDERAAVFLYCPAVARHS